MKPKRQLTNEQKLHPVTKGAGEVAKALPDAIPLTRSQSLSITALANDEQRLNRQATEIHKAIQATQAARAEVLEEIAQASGISSAGIGANYIFNGQNLIKPPAQE